MELQFKQAEAVFAKRFGIPEKKAVAFRGRLQHLQRLDFPPGVKTGRQGKKASYGWVQLIQLMVALDLIDLGLTPDLAAKSVRQGSDRILTAISEVVIDLGSAEALAKALKKARCPFPITQMAIASAYALTLPQDGRRALIQTMSGKQFAEQLSKDPAVEPAAVFVNLGSRIMLVGHLIGEVAGLDLITVATNLIQWSSDWAGQDTLS